MSHKPETSHRGTLVVVGDRGRVVLPAEIRRELGLEKGTKLQISTDADGSLRLRPYGAIAEANRGALAHLAPPGVSLVDELISGRRQEARHESGREPA